MHSSTLSWKKHRSLWILIGLSVIAIYVVVPQIGSLHNSWHLITGARLSWVFLAAALTFATYFSAACIYYFLAFSPLRYGELVLVQLAAMFVNRLLPAGIGALGSNFSYLKHHNHSSTQAATVVGSNNLLGFVGNALVLLFLLAFFSNELHLSQTHEKSSVLKVLIIIVVIVVALTVTAILGRNRLHNFWKDLRAQILSYKTRPDSLFLALFMSITLTLANMLCLAACAQALNIHLSFVKIALVFTLGVGTGSAVPTAGGLGGFEAGLFAGFVAYGVPNSDALALALLYRLISYWLPLLVGLPALVISQKKKLF